MSGAIKIGRRALLAAMAAVPAVRAFARGPAIGMVAATRGPVFRVADGRREPATKGMALHLGDAVVTDPGGKAKLQLNDGTIVSVGESARLVLMQYQGSDNGFTTRVRADSGAMRFFFLKTLDLSRFEVETETAVAAVRGTDWLMDMRPGHTAVATLAGVVAVTSKAGGEVVLEGTRQGTDVRSGTAPTPPAPWGAARFAATLARASFEG